MYTIPHLDLPPLLRAGGRVQLPGSKSISNRVLLLAGLAEGATNVHALLESDDTRVMLDALSALGCTLQPIADGVRVVGLGGQLRTRQAQLFLGNAGTAMRPLTAALSLLAATQGGNFEVSGVDRMHERPIGDLVDALRQLGCVVDELGTPGYPPLRLGDGALHSLDTAKPIRVRGDVSSQFLTALLLALPLLAEKTPVVVEVDGELISKPYVEITLKLLTRFGISVQHDNLQRFVIPQGAAYRSPGEIHVEGDASSASYFIALGAIAGIDAPVQVAGLDRQSIQGDVAFADAAAAMGAVIDSGPGWLSAKRCAWPLKAIDLDCNAIPDAAMTLAMMALYADGPSMLRNIGSWRVKETDRIAAIARELTKLGADVREGPDWIRIAPPAVWRSAAMDTYDDHRMAMCASLAAFNGLAGATPPLPQRVRDPRCVGKTFPEYFEAFFALCSTESACVPVLTIDGPTASGKGTLASELARRLGYRLLDSGALYRATALVALQRRIAPDDAAQLAEVAAALPLRFAGGRTWLGDDEVTDALRREEVGVMASQVSAVPEVRAALHALQLSFRRAPGLVADGRDMGTALFPDATLKVYLSASAVERARRRHRQLLLAGVSSNIDSLSADLAARDARDQNRSASPLKPAEDALLLDNSGLSVEDSVEQVLSWWHERRPFA